MIDREDMADLFAAVAPTPPPPHASKHCRHYSYVRDGAGPTCSQGCDLSGRGAAIVCMPPGAQEGKTFEPCPWREEFTTEEAATWREWAQKTMTRSIAIQALIPGSSVRPDESWGKDGAFDCPACTTGRVRWLRTPNNGHLWARCTTPECFEVME